MWGEFSDLPYATACEREPEHVPDNERRAIELMRSLCDEERFNYYIQTGLLFARGNITGITYRLEHGRGHGCGVYELEDGQTVASWCIQPTEDVPSTDHVLAIKNMIEGEEAIFRMTGNRSNRRGEPRNHHHDEGTFRNIAAPRAMPAWEASICGEPDQIETRDILGVMVYRDTYFQPEGVMADRFGLKRVNDDILECDLPPKDQKRALAERLMGRPAIRVCHTNDLYPYEGVDEERERRIHHIANQMRAGTYPIDPMIPLYDGEAYGPAGEIDCNNPDDQGGAVDNPDFDPIFNNPNQIGIGVNGAGQWNPIYGQNTLIAANTMTSTYGILQNYDQPGERAETQFDRLAYADEIIRLRMTEPYDDHQTERFKQALEVEL